MYYIGIDLGGTNIAAGLVDESGKIIASKSIPTLKEREADIICKDMIELCKSIMEENNLTKENINSVGVGTPGLIDSHRGIIARASNLKFEDFPIVEIMTKALGIPVYVGNDADCAALGEVTSGIAKGCANAIIVTLGTGVGGGLIVDGKIYKGSFPGAGEIGHQSIVHGGRLCGCGRRGCFEKYASASALINDAKHAAIDHPESLLNTYINGDVNKMNAKIPFDAAQEGDLVAKVVVEEFLSYLANGIANLINIFKPEMIILGGGVAKQGDKLTKPLLELVRKESYSKELYTKIEVALLGNDAGIIGAAMLGK